MTTSSDPREAAPTPVAASVALGAGRERRLHPLSWLFVLIDQLRPFALPMAALLLFGRGGASWEWYGLVGVAVLTLLAVVRYFTYRFRIAGGELVIRSGILHRNVRHIPLPRIQNVALKRNLLHRMLGVAEVRLESAVGGVSAEAQMRVLSLRDAHAIETLVRASTDAGAGEESEAEPERGELLLTLSTLELVKLGLTSNRGLLLGAAGVGVFSQLGDGLTDLAAASARSAFGYAQGLHLGWLPWLLVGSMLIGALVLAMRAISVALVLLRYHGFRLHELDQRLSVESGLLTRVRSHAPLRKIQHWTLRESLLHRLFARRSLSIETAVMQLADEAQAISAVVPIAPPARIDALLARWLPWLEPESLDWQPLHPRAWRRLATWPVGLSLLAALLLGLRFGAFGLLPLLTLPWWIYRARRIAAGSYWAISDRVLAWRSGWLDRHLSFAEIGKLQGVELRQSPFDRRHRMATVIADTAGANPLGHRLELSHLPEDVARALYARLGARIARSRLQW